MPTPGERYRCDQTCDYGMVQDADGTWVQAAAAAELEAELERYKNPLPGDLEQQSAAWIAVSDALKDAGMLSFFGGDMTGRGRAVAFIEHMAKELTSLRAIVEPLQRLLPSTVARMTLHRHAASWSVVVSDEWTGWDLRQFTGPTLAAALAAAEAARNETEVRT